MSETATVETPTRAPRKAKQLNEKRMISVPVWVDGEVNEFAKSAGEGKEFIYAAAAIAFLKLSAEEQVNAIGEAKLTNLKISKEFSK